MTKLEKFISKANPHNERDFYLSIGGYWVLFIDNNVCHCIFDNGKNISLDDNCKIETKSISQKNIKYLYSIINGYLKNKTETI